MDWTFNDLIDIHLELIVIMNFLNKLLHRFNTFSNVLFFSSFLILYRILVSALLIQLHLVSSLSFVKKLLIRSSYPFLVLIQIILIIFLFHSVINKLNHSWFHYYSSCLNSSFILFLPSLLFSLSVIWLLIQHSYSYLVLMVHRHSLSLI